MAKFTLDDIKAAAERKYGALELDIDGHEVRLLNPLKMSSENRKALIAKQEELNAQDEARENGEEVPEVDQEVVLDDMLKLIAATEGQAKHLIRHLDLAEKATVFGMYQEHTELGEASASQD